MGRRNPNMIVLLLLAGSLTAEKPPAAPPKTYPTTRTFDVSCESLWPVALQVLTSSGWGVKASDRVGGVLSLEWTKGQQVGGFEAINRLVGKYTTAKSTGFWTQYRGFRHASAQVVAIPKGAQCAYALTVVHHGFERRQQGENWWVLESNGFLENETLGQIEAKLKPSDRDR